MAVEYCEASDVQQVMGLRYQFSDSTYPTLTDIDELIEDAQDEIDQICMHSWRETTVTNEYHDFPARNAMTLRSSYAYGAGVAIQLGNRAIRTLSSGSGDKLEIWTGDSYEDYLVTKTEGRNEDFWLDYEQGILYLKQRYKWSQEKAIRITYRFGESSVPRDIKKATALRVAMEIIAGDDESQATNETGDFKTFSHDNKYSRWRARFNKILSNRKEMKLISF